MKNQAGSESVSPDKISVLARNEHKTQMNWVNKIQTLWEKLESHKDYSDVIRIEEQIKENKQIINVIHFEYIKENARGISGSVKYMEKVKARMKIPSIQKLEKKLLKVQKRIQKSSDRNAELNIWGVSSHVISYTIKCRVLEDLIDCAQRCKVRADATVERELKIMRKFQV